MLRPFIAQQIEEVFSSMTSSCRKSEVSPTLRISLGMSRRTDSKIFPWVVENHNLYCSVAFVEPLAEMDPIRACQLTSP